MFAFLSRLVVNWMIDANTLLFCCILLGCRCSCLTNMLIMQCGTNLYSKLWYKRVNMSFHSDKRSAWTRISSHPTNVGHMLPLVQIPILRYALLEHVTPHAHLPEVSVPPQLRFTHPQSMFLLCQADQRINSELADNYFNGERVILCCYHSKSYIHSCENHLVQDSSQCIAFDDST